jgi:eukaryotic-like serine/threonine-protein kinase
MQRQSAGRFVRFGSFEVDLRDRKLTKMGSRIRLQEQPFRILAFLLEHSGELVTREEIRQKLWPQDVHVDFDAALNTAVRKLRDALNDLADNPRFLETVPRQGYRFLAPVTWPVEPLDVLPHTSRIFRHVYLLVLAAVILAGSAILAIWHFRRHRSPITPEDTIVLADFANSTGDEVFDGTLKTALSLSLRQSPFFNMLSPGDVARTLQQMTRPADTKLTPELARELCQRAGSKAYLAGSIGTMGSKYVVGLRAVNCKIGVTLAEEESIAASIDNVLDALGEAG